MLETLWNIFAWTGILCVSFSCSLVLYAIWKVLCDKVFDLGPKFVLLIAASVVTSHAQTTTPTTDTVANKLYSEQLLFGDGWLSEWRASRAEARADRAEILDEVRAIQKLFDGSILRELKGLIIWLVVLVSVVQLSPILKNLLAGTGGILLMIYSAIRNGLFNKVSLVLLCLVPSITCGEEPQANIPQPNLVMFCGQSCSACEQWKLQVLPALLPRGWHVLIVQGKEAPYPRFLIKRGDKWIPHVGFLQINRLRQILEER